MVTSNIKATLSCDLQRVWDVVTSLTECSWRSDIREIEVISDRQFVEITRGGYKTKFTITAQEPCNRWEFDMENDNMKGHWIGIFTENKGKTTIDLTEHVMPKKWFLKPFVKIYLRKQQVNYVKDLMKVLG